ncbi:uncharacterized protein LOC131224502 [Magnolia sinica]|uniref:uncharacterized protein LOC131224502 n=1 Tax=Magnolia sinica TaxID=86752 RepID=UPI0026585F79|nr:uncharacterized protein LOC131224502 [Magnolia sinica]
MKCLEDEKQQLSTLNGLICAKHNTGISNPVGFKSSGSEYRGTKSTLPNKAWVTSFIRSPCETELRDLRASKQPLASVFNISFSSFLSCINGTEAESDKRNRNDEIDGSTWHCLKYYPFSNSLHQSLEKQEITDEPLSSPFSEVEFYSNSRAIKESESCQAVLGSRCQRAIVAVNADIVDIDLVLEGQRLNIPPSAKEAQMDSASTNQLDHCNIHERCQSSSSILGAHENQRIFTLLSSQHIQLAKPTGYFLVLVPLIAFCIRCIIGTFHHRLPKQLKHQAVNESKGHHQRSRSERWKSVLIRESDVADAESRQDLVNPSDDQSQVPFEDISRAYTKLEPAYLKFLSECGMSKWGYWRGGSLE